MKRVHLSFILLSGIFLLPKISVSQCMMYKVPLNDRVANSTLIVEGKVLQSVSFWTYSPNLIYTSHLIKVYNVFKGNYSASTIELITEGGIVGDKMHEVTPSLHLSINDYGVFFLEPKNIALQFSTGQSTQYFPYASMQGFIKYNKGENTATDPFDFYNDIDIDVVNVLEQLVGHVKNIIQMPDIQISSPLIMMPPPAVSVTSFSPTSLNAGTFDTLTINGTGFGALGGSAGVYFRNSDDGGATIISTPANHILSWSPTQIKVLVVTRAGTGKVRVYDSGGLFGESASNLTVVYDHLNVVSGGIYYQQKLASDNGSGGYTFVYNTTFNSNASAVASFERAIGTWRCGTYVNFTRSGTSAIALNSNDLTNLVTFDGSSALPGGVLGTCYSYNSACWDGSGWRWIVDELDVKMRTNGTGGITWNYGPGATSGASYDFESVSVHELGHGHQLGHVISSGLVMHYAISNATDIRTLNAASDVAGGNAVMTRSVISHPCGTGAMTILNSCNCPLTMPANGGAGTWTWTGGYNTNWFDPCNWNPVSLPDGLSDVVIPSGTSFQPTITGAAASCNTIQISSSTGANLIINTTGGGTLTVTQ